MIKHEFNTIHLLRSKTFSVTHPGGTPAQCIHVTPWTLPAH